MPFVATVPDELRELGHRREALDAHLIGVADPTPNSASPSRRQTLGHGCCVPLVPLSVHAVD
jgi:hypothetical protein